MSSRLKHHIILLDSHEEVVSQADDLIKAKKIASCLFVCWTQSAVHKIQFAFDNNVYHIALK